MEKRSLGGTGLKVSVLGFGASPLGGVFGDVTQSDADRMVRRALDAEINLFDVSPYYGKTRAESALGLALEGISRDSFVLATKVGRYDDAEFDFSAERTIRSVDESLARLKVDFIDLIQCHDIEFVPLELIVNETIPTLRRLQALGKVRHVGITGLPLKIFPAVLSCTQVDTILSYCHHTLYDDSLSTLLEDCAEKNVGVINAAPFGMGLLTGRPLPAWHPAPESLRHACANAWKFCEDLGIELNAIALAWALQEPLIASTLVGIGSIEQLESNLACVGVVPNTDILEGLNAIFAPVRNQSWLSGLPENNGNDIGA